MYKKLLPNDHELHADILSLLQAAIYSYAVKCCLQPMPCPTKITHYIKWTNPGLWF